MPTFDTLQDAISAGYVRLFTQAEFYEHAKDAVNVRIASEGTIVLMILTGGV